MWVLLGMAALLAGCAGIPVHRERQLSEAASRWDTATTARLLDERIQLGDTREMVYVALGMPLNAPTMTNDQPPMERWEYLVFETTPPFPKAGADSGAAAALESSTQQASIRAVTTNNVVFPPIGGPDARMLTVDFGPDDKVAAWKLYPDANGGFIPPGFMEITIPKSPRVKSEAVVVGDTEQSKAVVEADLPGLAALLKQQRPDAEGMAKLFTDYLNQHPQVYGVCFAPPLAAAGEPVRPCPYVCRKGGMLTTMNLAKPDYVYVKMDWYALPVSRQAAVWSPPYFDKGGGDIWMITYSLPIYLDEAKTQLYGVLTDDLPVPAPK